jgi:ABC-type Zn uptake system ZnuABC Zn-binding protein ZnuA
MKFKTVNQFYRARNYSVILFVKVLILAWEWRKHMKIDNSVIIVIFLPVATASLIWINTSFGSENVTNSTGQSPTVASRLKVITSVSPITNIVKNIGGDRIDLVGIIPEGSDSHTFELVPSDVVKMKDADLVIIDGLNLEGGMEKIANEAKNKNSKIQLLKLGDNTITKDQWEFDFSFPKEKRDPNPHLWLNVAYAMKFANLTQDKLIEMDQTNADYYTSNTNRYITLLKDLDNGIMQAVQTVPPQNRKLLTYHDSWAYFAPSYGMVVIGAVQPSDFGEPSPQDIAKLIDQIRSEKVPAIFASEVYTTKVVDQIGREGNVTFVETLSDDALPGQDSDPIHTYVGMMLENMKNMLVPLGGNVKALQGIDPSNTYGSDNSE